MHVKCACFMANVTRLRKTGSETCNTSSGWFCLREAPRAVVSSNSNSDSPQELGCCPDLPACCRHVARCPLWVRLMAGSHGPSTLAPGKAGVVGPVRGVVGWVGRREEEEEGKKRAQQSVSIVLI